MLTTRQENTNNQTTFWGNVTLFPKKPQTQEQRKQATFWPSHNCQNFLWKNFPEQIPARNLGSPGLSITFELPGRWRQQIGGDRRSPSKPAAARGWPAAPPPLPKDPHPCPHRRALPSEGACYPLARVTATERWLLACFGTRQERWHQAREGWCQPGRGSWCRNGLSGLPWHLPMPPGEAATAGRHLPTHSGSLGFPTSLLTPKSFKVLWNPQSHQTSQQYRGCPVWQVTQGAGERLSVIQILPSQPSWVQFSQAQAVTIHTPGQSELQTGIVFAHR